MILNTNSFLAKFYIYSFVDLKLPMNKLIFFFKIIFAILILPITLPGIIVNIKNKAINYNKNLYYEISKNKILTFPYYFLFSGYLFVFGCCITLNIVDNLNVFMHLPIIYFVGILTTTIIILLLDIIFFVCKYIKSEIYPEETEAYIRLKEFKTIRKNKNLMIRKNKTISVKNNFKLWLNKTFGIINWIE